jgi:hypothetical protein
MATKKVLIVCALAVLLVGWGVTSGVLAEEAEEAVPSGTVNSEIALFETLGTGTFATDVFHILCGAGANHLAINLTDNGGVDNIRINVCVHDSGGNPARCTMAPDGATTPSFLDPAVIGGPGVYYVTFSKSANATGSTRSYTSVIECHNASHNPVGLTPVLVQDQ